MKKCTALCCTQIRDLSVEGILENINIHIHCGEITAIIGSNGAGKSTLLKAIIGERKHKGEICFVGENGSTTPIVGYVPQSMSFDADCPSTVADLFFACGIDLNGDAAKKAVETVGITEFFDRKLSALSGGELQRAMLALALVPMPNLLLLDEPVSGVDKVGTEKFWEIISSLRKDYDMTIIIVSHNHNHVKKYADRVVLLNKYIVAHGTAEEVFASKEYSEIFDS